MHKTRALGKLKINRKMILMVCAVAVGLILLLYPSGEADSGEGDGYKAVTSYTERLEERIRKLCLSVDGVSKANVLVTLECGSEYVYADNVSSTRSDGGSDYTSDYLIVESGDGTSPVTVTEIYPRIRGVAVVCSGGDSVNIQKKLTELLSAALGIGTNKIKISS